MKLFIGFILLASSSLVALSFSSFVNEENMWWCRSCGLAYPASQKVCLNKDCPMFKKKK